MSPFLFSRFTRPGVAIRLSPERDSTRLITYGPKEDLAMSSPTSEPVLSVLVPLPSDLARTIDTLAKQRGQDRVQFIVNFLHE